MFFNVVGKIGDAIGPAMVNNRPVQLLLLNSSNAHCILTTTSVPFLPWIIITVLRRFCEDPLYFFIGLWYRDTALALLKKYLPDVADGFVKAEGMFKSNLYVAVAVNPGATVCALAGASRMKKRWFFGLNLTCTVVQLLIIRYVCSMMPSKLDRVLDVINEYMKICLIIMIAATLYPMAHSREAMKAYWNDYWHAKLKSKQVR